MKPHGARSYALWSLAVALGTAALLSVYLSLRSTADARWVFIGWGLMALVGVFGGNWIASRLGRPGSGFLAALAVCMLARLVAAAAAAWVVAGRSAGEIESYLVGLIPTFVFLQACEVIWFYRQGLRWDRLEQDLGRSS